MPLWCEAEECAYITCADETVRIIDKGDEAEGVHRPDGRNS